MGDDSFYLTYGDAVSDINIKKLTDFHRRHGKCVTLTSVSIAQQKGILDVDENNTVRSFREKDDVDGSLINAGFMVCNSGIFSYLSDDNTVLEQEPMRRLAADGELKSYYHNGFWQCMDTKREKDKLEALWTGDNAPWKTWKDD